MSEEMIMKVLDMVGQAGEGGYTLALVMVLDSYFSTFIWASVIMTTVWLVAKVLITAAKNERLRFDHYLEVEENLRQIRDRLDVGSSGTYTKNEHRQVLAKIHELRKAQEAEG